MAVRRQSKTTHYRKFTPTRMPGRSTFQARLEEQGLDYRYYKSDEDGVKHIIEVNGIRVRFGAEGYYISSETI